MQEAKHAPAYFRLPKVACRNVILFYFLPKLNTRCAVDKYCKKYLSQNKVYFFLHCPSFKVDLGSS